MMNCKDCCQDCQRIGCDIELGCSGYVEPSNGTKERMDERLEMIHKLYPDAKPTNADRIRCMSDEELANFYFDFFFPQCPYCECDPEKPCPEHNDCKICLLEWLQQEV